MESWNEAKRPADSISYQIKAINVYDLDLFCLLLSEYFILNIYSADKISFLSALLISF